VWGLFPLDGAGGLGGNIVDDAVDALDLVDDAVGVWSSEFGVRSSECRGRPLWLPSG